MSDSRKGDAEKARYWQRTISEAARSGISIRQFCRQRPAERESVLLVAAQAEGQSACRDDVETKRPGEAGQLCPSERGSGSDGCRDRISAGRWAKATYPPRGG